MLLLIRGFKANLQLKRYGRELIPEDFLRDKYDCFSSCGLSISDSGWAETYLIISIKSYNTKRLTTLPAW